MTAKLIFLIPYEKTLSAKQTPVKFYLRNFWKSLFPHLVILNRVKNLRLNTGFFEDCALSE